MEIKTYTPETVNNDAFKALKEKIKAARANRENVKTTTKADPEKVKAFLERIRASRKTDSQE